MEPNTDDGQAGGALAVAAPVPRLALKPAEAAVATGFSVRRIFEAIEHEELTAIKSRNNGKATTIAVPELSRWLGTLPTRGRKPKPAAA